MKSFTNAVFFLLFFFSFVSCKNNSSDNNSEGQKTAFTCQGNQLNFDRVEAYSISFEALRAIEDRENQTDENRFLLQLVNSFRTKNLKEVNSVKLIEIGFAQKHINEEDYKSLCELFQEQYVYEDTTACQAIFRDIMLFKRETEVDRYSQNLLYMRTQCCNVRRFC